MFPELQKFIETNIELIENARFDELYNMNVDVSKFTEVLLKAGINPLEKLNYIPAGYLCQSDINSFTVPAHITEIHSGAFWKCENLNKVILPEGLVSIEDSAFCECHNLWQINFPSTLEFIKEDAFAETNLHHIVVPDLVGVIPKHCFEACKQLQTVKLGKFANRIKTRAFAECDNLYSVQLNDGLTSIDSYAFTECPALTEIYIPDSVTTIAANVFWKSPTKIICSENSAAHRYALHNDMRYELI